MDLFVFNKSDADNDIPIILSVKLTVVILEQLCLSNKRSQAALLRFNYVIFSCFLNKQ